MSVTLTGPWFAVRKSLIQGDSKVYNAANEEDALRRAKKLLWDSEEATDKVFICRALHQVEYPVQVMPLFEEGTDEVLPDGPSPPDDDEFGV